MSIHWEKHKNNENMRTSLRAVLNLCSKTCLLSFWNQVTWNETNLKQDENIETYCLKERLNQNRKTFRIVSSKPWKQVEHKSPGANYKTICWSCCIVVLFVCLSVCLVLICGYFGTLEESQRDCCWSLFWNKQNENGFGIVLETNIATLVLEHVLKQIDHIFESHFCSCEFRGFCPWASTYFICICMT